VANYTNSNSILGNFKLGKFTEMSVDDLKYAWDHKYWIQCLSARFAAPKIPKVF
jgi:hypothetical protein